MDETTRARALLHEWVQSESLRRHVEAVSICMGHFARLYGENEDRWRAVGLLHDMDYERYPDLSEAGHPFMGVQMLREQGWDEEVCRAILSHADYSGIARETTMEKVLYAVDELSGFVTAVALMRPDKSIHSTEATSVRKKMKDKAFAAKVSRDDMLNGAADLHKPIEEMIQEVINAMRGEADVIGLGGISVPV